MLANISTRVFGNIVRPYMPYFDGLSNNLKKGAMRSTTHEYVSMLFFGSLVTFVTTLVAGSFFLTMLLSMITTLPMMFSFTLTIILSAVLSAGVFFGGYYYPTMRANSNQKRIERNLPFAVFFMATASTSGIHPVEIFKTLSQRRGVIGEEANKIYSNTKTLGMNLTDSIAKVASRSPSPQFADLLWGMISILTTGGDLEDYLNNKTRTFMTTYRLSLNDYAKRIALYTEIYITLVMVGSLFFIVLTAIMSPLGGLDILMIQTFVVFFITPAVSVAYIVLLKGSSPLER